jgi:hypothetical protein
MFKAIVIAFGVLCGVGLAVQPAKADCLAEPELTRLREALVVASSSSASIRTSDELSRSLADVRRVAAASTEAQKNATAPECMTQPTIRTMLSRMRIYLAWQSVILSDMQAYLAAVPVNCSAPVNDATMRSMLANAWATYSGVYRNLTPPLIAALPDNDRVSAMITQRAQRFSMTLLPSTSTVDQFNAWTTEYSAKQTAARAALPSTCNTGPAPAATP